jgi:surface antigen
MKRRLIIVLFIFGAIAGFYVRIRLNKININTSFTVGQPLDSLHGVAVFYNGSVGHVLDRNTTPDGYNLGLRYQCVEFVKRYYYQHLGHKMPDSYGHARDFFDVSVADGSRNPKRDLLQFSHPSRSKPKPDDLIVFDGTTFNQYGHVAIVSEVTDHDIEIIQQNPGPYGKSRVRFTLTREGDTWEIDNENTLGWLRKD